MPVDFNLLQPLKGPGPEIASIGNLLSSFAEQRMRQQQQQQAAEQAQRQFEAQQANIAADNARADAQLEQQKQAHKDALDAQTAKEQDAAQKEAYKAVPGVKNALLAGDEPGARVAAGAGGITLNVDQQQAQAAQQAQQTRGQQMADSLSPFGPMLGGAMPVAAASATAAAPTDAEKAKRYLMQLPGSRVPLAYSPDEEQQAQRAQREKQSGELGTALQGTSPSPYSAQAIREAQGLMKTGQLKESPADWVAKRAQHLEDQANAKENARTKAASFASPELRNDTANRQDAASLERGMKDYVAAADSKTLLKSDRSLKAAVANISAKGPDAVMSHKDAFMQLERYFRGATPTDSETALLMKNMGGIPGAIQQYLTDLKSGDFSDITKRNITAAAGRAQEENKHNIDNVYQGLTERFGPGSEFSNMGPQVNRQVRAIGRLYGVDFPAIYPEATGGTVLGSGKRPAKSTNAGAPQAMPSTEDFLRKHGF